MSLTPDQLAAAVRGPPAQIAVATPINDIQLVAWIAGTICGGNRGVKPPEAVNAAMEIVAEAIVQMKMNGMGPLLDRAQQRLTLLQGQGHAG